jgi:hypothetical protein
MTRPIIAMTLAVTLLGCKSKDTESSPSATSAAEAAKTSETPKPVEAPKPTEAPKPAPTEAPQPAPPSASGKIATWGADCARSDELAHSGILPPEITIGAIQNTIGKPDLATMFEKRVKLVDCEPKQVTAAEMAKWFDATVVVPKSCTCKKNVCTFVLNEKDAAAATAGSAVVTYLATGTTGLSEVHVQCTSI